MKAYYKQGWGITFIILGIVLLVLHLMLANMGQVRIMQIVLGIFICIMGAMYMSKPCFELRNNELVLFNLFGMELKRYPFEKLSDFQVNGNKIELYSNGKLTRVKISKAMVRTEDWDAFIKMISGHDLTRELHNI